LRILGDPKVPKKGSDPQFSPHLELARWDLCTYAEFQDENYYEFREFSKILLPFGVP